MKKKLEAELISIAHRILKLKNKEDVIQLHQETQKLYEKLSILRFYEENFEALKPTLTHEELEEKIETAYVVKEEIVEDVKEEVITVLETTEEIPVEEEKILVGQVDVDENEIDEEETVIAEEKQDLVEEEPQTEENNVPLFEPVQEEAIEEVKKDKKTEPQQISFEDLMGDSYTVPDFVKVNDVPEEVGKATESIFEKAETVVIETKEEVVDKPKAEKPMEFIKEEIAKEKEEYRAASLNDKFSKTISLVLNDRITFEKHLFGGSGEDLNRVLSQLNTFNTLEEAKTFIDDLVKPDYNNWEGKDEYSSRFMELVANKFA
jgi:hypothetical protein